MFDQSIVSSSSFAGIVDAPRAGLSAMIREAEMAGHWPVRLEHAPVQAVPEHGDPVACGEKSVVAYYPQHARRHVGMVSKRFRSTPPDEWRSLLRAAEECGAEPVSGASFHEGSVTLATFRLDADKELANFLHIADSFDGSFALSVGTSSIRPRCTNALRRAMRESVRVRHSSQLVERIAGLKGEIRLAAESGKTTRRFLEATEARRLSRDESQALFDALFPPAADDAPEATKTRAENARSDALRAASLQINNCGPTVATLWNAATYLVDRNANGTPRATRGTDRLGSMLFGARGDRVEEIQSIVEYVMRDGSIQSIPISEAIETDGAKQDFAALMGAPASVL